VALRREGLPQRRGRRPDPGGLSRGPRGGALHQPCRGLGGSDRGAGATGRGCVRRGMPPWTRGRRSRGSRGAHRGGVGRPADMGAAGGRVGGVRLRARRALRGHPLDGQRVHEAGVHQPPGPRGDAGLHRGEPRAVRPADRGSGRRVRVHLHRRAVAHGALLQPPTVPGRPVVDGLPRELPWGEGV